MVQTIAAAILMGLGLSIMIGPAFFSLIFVTATQGNKSGLKYALGIFISDLIIISLLLLVSSPFETIINSDYTQKIGAVVLILIGLIALLVKKKKNDEEFRSKDNLIFAGITVSLLNPSIYILWLGISAINPINELKLFFLLAVAFTNFAIDIIKVQLAKILHQKLPVSFIFLSKYIVPSIFIITGVILGLKNLF